MLLRNNKKLIIHFKQPVEKYMTNTLFNKYLVLINKIISCVYTYTSGKILNTRKYNLNPIPL